MRFGLPCRVTEQGGSDREAPLTMIDCTAPEMATQDHFVAICEALLDWLGDRPSMMAVGESVRRFAAMFQNLTRAPTQTITGIIGELMVIFAARDTQATLAAWRTAFDQRFDFAVDDVRLEAKASSNRMRRHSFSYEQCHPPEGAEGIVVSLCVEASGGDMSLRELIQAIEPRLNGDHEAVFRLHETVAATLGSNLLPGLDACFDQQLAKQSMLFFDLRAIPAARGSLPACVSQVRFTTDLTAWPPLDSETLHRLSATRQGLLP